MSLLKIQNTKAYNNTKKYKDEPRSIEGQLLSLVACGLWFVIISDPNLSLLHWTSTLVRVPASALVLAGDVATLAYLQCLSTIFTVSRVLRIVGYIVLFYSKLTGFLAFTKLLIVLVLTTAQI